MLVLADSAGVGSSLCKVSTSPRSGQTAFVWEGHAIGESEKDSVMYPRSKLGSVSDSGDLRGNVLESLKIKVMCNY